MLRSFYILVRLFRWPALILSLVLTFRDGARADFFDKVNDGLSLSDSDHRFHLQLSGLVDLEPISSINPLPPSSLPTATFFSIRG